MLAHLRIARPVSDLARSVRMYKLGLDLDEVGRFADHDGFDGVMLGHKDAQYHFEFTYCRGHPVQPSPSPEDLAVLYVPDEEAWRDRCSLMLRAGFVEVRPFNPYWSRLGRTFQDPDRYNVVIQRDRWGHAAA